MKKSNIGTATIVSVLVVFFIGLVVWSLNAKQSSEVHYSEYNFNSVIAGNDDNGNIADHIKGNPDAPVKIFEYADFQCPGCATSNPRVNTLLEEYGDKLAVVYRNFLLSYHKNGTAAASAAEAAGLQGYWKEYADILFSNQSTWEYASATERTSMFVDLFRNVTNGNGDLAKFEKDMGSAEVAKKITFDQGIGKRVDVQGTPAFYLDGELIDFSGAGAEADFLELFRSKIDAKLEELNQK